MTHDTRVLYHNGVSYAIESHISGGVLLVARRDTDTSPTYYINDLLGTTLAVVSADHIEIVSMTAFGKFNSTARALRTDQESDTQPVAEKNSLPVTTNRFQ